MATYTLEISDNYGTDRHAPHRTTLECSESEARARLASVTAAECQDAYGATSHGQWCVSLGEDRPDSDGDMHTINIGARRIDLPE